MKKERESRVVEPSDGSNELNLLRSLLKRLRRYYLLYIVFILIAIAVQYFTARYSVNTYQSNGMLMVKEKGYTQGLGNILYNTGMQRMYRPLENEIMFLESGPFIDSVLKRLPHFRVSYFLPGNIKSTELYESAPFKIELDSESSVNSNTAASAEFWIQFINETEYYLQPGTKDTDNIDPAVAKKYYVYQTIKTENFNFRVRPLQMEGEGLPLEGLTYKFTIFGNYNLVNHYLNKVRVGRVSEEASAITISMVSSNPRKDQDFINHMMEEYMEQKLAIANQTSKNTLRFIDNQLSQLRDSLYELETNLEAFKSDNSYFEIGEVISMEIQNLNELKKNRAELQVKESYFNYLDDYLTAGPNETNTGPLVAPSTVLITDPILNKLVSKLVDLQLEVETYKNEGMLNNPYFKTLKEEIANVKQSLKENLSSLRRANKLSVEDIDKRAEQISRKLRAIPGQEKQFLNIKRLQQVNQEIYLLLLKKRLESEIELASNSIEASIIEPASSLNTVIVSQGAIQKYGRFVLIALILPTLFVFIREAFNNKVKDEEELKTLTNLPILASISSVKKNHNKFFAFSSDAEFNAPKERFRILRSNLSYVLDGSKDSNVIMFTSFISKEGKSFCSSHLAAFLALSGKKTLLLGGDMRKINMYNIPGVSNEVGLSQYLAGHLSLEEVIQKTQEPNFRVINSGPIPPDPSELLSGSKIVELLDTLKKEYNYIIIDTPPLIISDPIVLMKHADVVLYVVRQNFTLKSHLKRFSETNMQEKGYMIFNGISQRNSNYYYSMYGYYGYGNYGSPEQSLWQKIVSRINR